jgi:hypothetical protein
MSLGYLGYGRAAKRILYQDMDPDKRQREMEQIEKFKKYYHKRTVNLLTIGYVFLFPILFTIGHVYFFTLI